MSTFANRRSRCKELGKKVPQAYRVYVEDTFLPCDAADTRIFAKENFLSLYNALHDTHLQLSTMFPALSTIRLSYLLNTLAQECTSVYILELQVCRANLFLRGTSGIRAASDTGKNSTNKGQKLITRRQFIRASTFENR